LNSLFAAWDECASCVEIFKLGAKDSPGTYDFLGPMPLFDRREDPPRRVFEFFDTAGFSLNDDVDGKRSDAIVRATLGTLKPGDRLIKYNPKFRHAAAKLEYAWQGVDICILVVKSAEKESEEERENIHKRMQKIQALYQNLNANGT
jgi:hypothetical protein